MVMSVQVQSEVARQEPDGPIRNGAFSTALTQLRLLLNPIETVAARFARFGDIYRVPQQGGALYVLRDPEHIRDVLVTNGAAFDKQHGAFRRMSLLLGDALLTSDGERWRRQRRLVQPAFARPRLVEYAAIMVEEAERTRERLVRSKRVDLSAEMNALTLRVVTRTLFGQTDHSDNATSRAMLELNRWFALPPQLLKLWPGAERRFEAAIAELDRVIDNLIERKRAEAIRGESGRDLLSALMSARDEDGAALSPRELRDQLLTLYLAGHETTSHALTWTLYLLSRNPAARAKLQAELHEVLQGRAPTFDDLTDLPYTERVVKEGLRLYPPAFALPRHAAQDTTIGPYTILKGSEVVIWVYHTHRNPRFYPEPTRFMPERFEPALEATRPKHAYLPFGAGQRACIGQQFAMIEAQLIIATLLPQLEFEALSRRPPRPRTGVTLAPRGGLPMRVRKRSA
jgi:cytochrome P450